MNNPDLSNRAVDYVGSDLENLVHLRRYRAWIIDLFQPYLHGRAVECGAGTGSISELLVGGVESLDLVEPSANQVATLQARFGGMKHVNVVSNTLESWIADTADDTYDVAILVNVLEHIEDDSQALRELFRILKPGGHLLLMVPGLKFLFSNLDVFYGHFRRYDMDELESRVTAARFDIHLAKHFDILGVLPWWLLNTVLGSTTFNPTLMKVYDRVFVPLTRRIESVVVPPIGKNIILVAKKTVS